RLDITEDRDVLVQLQPRAEQVGPWNVPPLRAFLAVGPARCWILVPCWNHEPRGGGAVIAVLLERCVKAFVLRRCVLRARDYEDRRAGFGAPKHRRLTARLAVLAARRHVRVGRDVADLPTALGVRVARDASPSRLTAGGSLRPLDHCLPAARTVGTVA